MHGTARRDDAGTRFSTGILTRLRHAACVLVLLLPPSAYAQTPTPLPDALRSARTNLLIGHGAFAGTAAPILTAAIDGARYVLIGEDHLTREIPRFAATVCDTMAPHGLDALAVEAAPQASTLVAPLLATGTAAPGLRALLHAHPDSVAFLDMRDEVDLATHCSQVATSGHFHYWGIDQAFLGASGWLLQGIAARPLNPAEGAAAAQFRVQDQRDTQAANTNGDPGPLLLLAPWPADLRQAARTLHQAADPAARALFAALAASHDIYADPSGADSNRKRALLLKQTLAADLGPLQLQTPAARVLIKMGSSHLFRGFNELHQLDLGNYVAERADGEAAGSLHIAILGAKGVHRLFAGYDRPTRLQSFVLTDDPDYAWLKPAIDSLLPTGWTLFDLRALRFRTLTGLNADWSRMIYGYDFLIIIPTLTPADPL